MNIMKGQAATESILMAGFVIAFTIPILVLLYSAVNLRGEQTALSQARLSAKSIADYAGELYVQGDGSTRIVLVNYPPSLRNIIIGEHEVVFWLELSGRRSDVVAPSLARMRSSPERSLGSQRDPLFSYLGSGVHAVNLTNVDGVVEISYASQ